MGLFQLFKQDKTEQISQLEAKLKTDFPDIPEDELSDCSCYAGLLCKVAYSDMTIDLQEKTKMAEILSHFTQLSSQTIERVVQLATQDMQELSGIEDHFYTNGLKDRLNNQQKGQLLIALFHLAAIDQKVNEKEVEIIRAIATGLNLGRQHFIAAKAQVKDQLVILGQENP